MKAIIMAGGKGTRLKPLTCTKPKPMVYLANNPVMTHTIELLKKHGITDIGVTLQHMSSQIMDYYADGKDFGVNLKYFIEEIPLGTAGSVKNAQEFLDDTFLVISGDGLTDIDLKKAIQFHKEKKSLATLILTSVGNPLEYGIVVTKETGEIIKFLEKPSWGEVFSDKVNTGMYILEPEVLDFIPAETFYDFSKNLFPLLMDKGITLYGFNGEGYWCDIGNCQAYLEAHIDILMERVTTFMPYKELLPKIWVGENTEIDPSAQLIAPLVIGNNCYIGANTVIGPHSFIGNNCIIGNFSSIKRSVLWNGIQIGKRAALRGAVICSNVNIKNNASVYEGAIVGPECTLNENCLVKPGSKIWPGKKIEEGSVVKDNLIWGTKISRSLFGSNGIKGQLNIDLFMGQILQIGSAFGSQIDGSLGKIGISSDDAVVSRTVKQALTTGLQIVGCQVYDLGILTLPICRFAINKGNLDGGIYVRLSPEDNLIQITFLNAQGTNIGKSLEKKIENAFNSDELRYVSPEKIKDIIVLENIYDLYFASLKNYFKEKLDFEVILTCPSEKLGKSIENLLKDLGCVVNVVSEEEFNTFSGGIKKGDIAVKFDRQADKAALWDEHGKAISGDKFKVLLASIIFNKYKKMAYVASVDEPSILERLAKSYDSNVLRCKTDLGHRMESMLKQGEYGREQFFMEFDGIYAVLNILDFLRKKQLTLSQAVSKLPEFHIYREALNCPWEIKGKILRSLLENSDGTCSDTIEGAKFMHPYGQILILPDAEKPLVNIISESNLMEIAQEISGNYRNKIQSLICSVTTETTEDTAPTVAPIN
ncbi:MAG: NTP transferase domain-containing protein [Clostridia bacterium]|nr:NTP transferase domain-containing protein [Clostridia bacterium]